MSTFTFYNIQVLPTNSKVSEIGAEGYKSIFNSINGERIDSINNRNIHSKAFKLPAKMYLAYFNMHSYENKIHGNFIKFDQPRIIYDTYTGDQVQKLPPGSSSQRDLYDFIFDADSHILSFESKSGSPSVGRLIEAFHHFLSPIVLKEFPEHELTIDVITDSVSVDQVFKNAEYYKYIEVEISFSNATTFVRKMMREQEQELREKSITKKKVIETTSERSGKISEPTDSMKGLLALAKTLGDASIRYFDKRVGKIKNFVYSNNPFKIQLRQTTKELKLDYLLRVNEASKTARDQANQPLQ